MPELLSLPGIKQKNIPCLMTKSFSVITKNLKNYRAFTCADSNGAINLFIGDDGVWRGERQLYCEIQEFRCFSEFSEVKGWWNEMIKRIK